MMTAYTRRFLCVWVIVTLCVATPMVTDNIINRTGDSFPTMDTTVPTIELMTSSENANNQSTTECSILTSQIPHSTSDGLLLTVTGNISLPSNGSGKRSYCNVLLMLAHID